MIAYLLKRFAGFLVTLLIAARIDARLAGRRQGRSFARVGSMSARNALKAASGQSRAAVFKRIRAGGCKTRASLGAQISYINDKAVYTYMPELIRFFTGEEPILKNVRTWKCADPSDYKYVLENLKDLVVKEVHGAGGYGMLGYGHTPAEVAKVPYGAFLVHQQFVELPRMVEALE